MVQFNKMKIKLAKLDNKEFRAFGILAVLMLLIAFINGTPFLFGDSFGYFHVGKVFTTQGVYPSSDVPDYYPYTGHAVGYFNEEYITPYSVGQGILWIPFLFVSSIFDNGTVFDNYYKAFNGHSLADGLAVLLAACTASYLGIIFTYLFLKELGFSKRRSFFVTLMVFLSLYLISYTFEQPGYSHVYEFFAYSGLLYSLLKCLSTKRALFLYIASIFAGLLVLIRVVDVVLIIPILALAVYRIRSKRPLLISAVILAVFGLIFLLYNHLSYGNAFTVGYNLSSGQSGIALGINVFNLLFSDTRGLFIWSPLILLSVIGLVWYSLKSKTAILIFLLPSILLLGVYNFWSNWWAGVSAGQRFFIVLAPLFALGIAYLLEKIKYKSVIKAAVLITTFYSLIVGVLYRVTPILSVANDFRLPELSRITPAEEDYRVSDLFIYHYRLLTQSGGVQNYLNNLTGSLNGGRSLILLTLGATDPLVKVEAISSQEYRVHFIPSNTQKNITTNTFIVFASDNIVKSYVIPNMNYKYYSVITIKCDAQLNCNSSDIDLVKAQTDITELELINVSHNIKMYIYGESTKLNFINRKLK